MFKKLLTNMMMLGLAFILIVPSSSANAESDIVGSCSITIDANKHKSGHSYANASGACKGEIFGDYGTEFMVFGNVTKVVKNGEVVIVPTLNGSYELTVKTIPLKEEPKPKPDPKPEPKPETNPKPSNPGDSGNSGNPDRSSGGKTSGGSGSSGGKSSGSSGSSNNSSGGSSGGTSGGSSSSSKGSSEVVISSKDSSNNKSSSSNNEQQNKSLSSSKSERKSDSKDNETKEKQDEKSKNEKEENTACEFSNLRTIDEKEYEVIVEDNKFIVKLEDKECEVSEVQAKLLGYEGEEELADENDTVTTTESQKDDEM